MRIAHLADIHVRDRRRGEYAAVFAKLAAALKKETPLPDVIAIAGDIFDTMTRASARNWEDVATLLSLLADIAPVALIPGNHDLNIRAEGTPDLIGPMLEAAGGARNLQPPRVTYWRNSGVFNFMGAVWLIAVPGQEKPNPADVAAALADSEGSPLVALFHESVGGAKYPSGVEAEDTPLSKSDLAAYAEAGEGRARAFLLGDIHLRQEVPFQGSGPSAAAWYPGSLVCQTFGEPHLGHGYLVWDLEGDRIRVTPRSVPNPRAPLTVRISADGGDVTPTPVPERPRAYRIVHSPDTPADCVEGVTKSYRDRLGFAPRSVGASVIPEAAMDAKADPTARTLAGVHADAADWARHEAYAREVLAGEPEARVEKAIGKYRAAVRELLGSRAAAPRAELVHLEFEDMFSYGVGNNVDFDALRRGRPGLVGFVAPNRAGKSNLFDILTFAICDEYPRGTKRDIPRRGGDGYRLRLTFRVDGVLGRVEKSGMRGELARRDNTISLWLGGEELTAKTTPETAKKIRELLGARAWLEATSLLRPSEVTGTLPFALMDAPSRRALLAGLLDLGSFDRLRKKADSEISSLRGERRGLLRLFAGGALSGAKEGELTESLPAFVAGKTLDFDSAAEDFSVAEGDEGDARAAWEHARDEWRAASKALSDAELLENSAAAAAKFSRADTAKSRRALSEAEAELARARRALRECAGAGDRPSLDAVKKSLALLEDRMASASRELRAAESGHLEAAHNNIKAVSLRKKVVERADEACLLSVLPPRERRQYAHKDKRLAPLSARLGGLESAYREALNASPPQPADVGNSEAAAKLEKVLKAIRAKHHRACANRELREELVTHLVDGCPGCAETNRALGVAEATDLVRFRKAAAVLFAQAAAHIGACESSVWGELSAAAAEELAQCAEVSDDAVNLAAARLDAARDELSAVSSEMASARADLVEASRPGEAALKEAVEKCLSRAASAEAEVEKLLAAEEHRAAEASAAAGVVPPLRAVAQEADRETLSRKRLWEAAHKALSLARSARDSAERDLEECKKSTLTLLEVDESVAVLAALRKILHPKCGVGAKFLADAVGGVEAEVGDALRAMEASFSVEFTADFALTLVDNATKTRTAPGLGSGYQQFVVAIATRWALARVARVALPSCFFIDEGFGCLDESNLPKVVEALGGLATMTPVDGYRPLVLAVTHREDMAPYFSERLEISCGDGGSCVSFPPGSAPNLSSIFRHVPRASAPEAAPEKPFCDVCRRKVALSRWDKHAASAAHLKAVANAKALGEVLASDPSAVLSPDKPGKITCSSCAGAFSVKQWARHAASARHKKALSSS